ncbi:uncharacterized protein [Diadema setosum]|uniref:uncharacterized protein n=1 Tax=Diadema setosum TaxID=31175 RepID=UPI003B3A367F
MDLYYSYAFNCLYPLVGTVPNVQGWKGEDIRLPCIIPEEPLAVYWDKESTLHQQPRTTKATFYNGDFESRDERFYIERNFSLVITDLKVADEGLYHCEVVLNNLERFENSVLTTVSSMASKHAIEECDDTSQSHQSRCTYQTPSNTPSFNLTCVVSGFKPNISMLWTKESGERLNLVVSHQTTLSDDTYERFETITVSAKRGIEQTFICTATGDSLNGTSTVGITIQPLPGPRVGTAPSVGGWKGQNIRLQCDIQEEPLAVVWAKDTISHQRVTKARFYDGIFVSGEERFDINRDFSLVITNLKVADEGRYHCQVVLNNLENFSNSTLVTVSSLASKHEIQECVDRSRSHQSRCTYQTSSNTPSFNLTCVVSGFKPNISMLWTEESGKILNSVASQQKTLSDDTYERFETITVTAKEETWQTFTCTATGDSLKGNSTAEITVLPIAVNRDDLRLIIGLAIGLPVALVILFLLVGKFLQMYHPDYLPRKGDVTGIPAGGDHRQQSAVTWKKN